MYSLYPADPAGQFSYYYYFPLLFLPHFAFYSVLKHSYEDSFSSNLFLNSVIKLIFVFRACKMYLRIACFVNLIKNKYENVSLLNRIG